MKDFERFWHTKDELVIPSLSNKAYSLNKVNKLAQDIVQGLKTIFYQWPVTLREGSPQPSIVTDDGMVSVSFSILNYSIPGILQGWKCRIYNTSMGISTQTCEPLGLGSSPGAHEACRGSEGEEIPHRSFSTFSALVHYSIKRLFLTFLILTSHKQRIIYNLLATPPLTYIADPRHSSSTRTKVFR